MSENVLQLNNDKTEVMIIAPDNITTKIRQVVGGLSSSDKQWNKKSGCHFDRSVCLKIM